MTNGQKARNDVWVAAVLAAASLFFLVYQWLNPVGSPIFGISSSTLPTAMSALILGLSLLLLVQSLISIRRVSRWSQPAVAEPGNVGETRAAGRLRLWSLVVLCVVYVAVMPWLGYLISSALFVGATALLFGNRRPLIIVGIMLVAPLAISFFFEKAMVIYLPASRLL